MAHANVRSTDLTIFFQINAVPKSENVTPTDALIIPWLSMRMVHVKNESFLEYTAE